MYDTFALAWELMHLFEEIRKVLVAIGRYICDNSMAVTELDLLIACRCALCSFLHGLFLYRIPAISTLRFKYDIVEAERPFLEKKAWYFTTQGGCHVDFEIVWQNVWHNYTWVEVNLDICFRCNGFTKAYLDISLPENFGNTFSNFHCFCGDFFYSFEYILAVEEVFDCP